MEAAKEITLTKEQLSALPAESFSLPIEVVQTPATAVKAIKYLKECELVGFDTETRPSFRKGELHSVALMQVSTAERCFLFRLNRTGLTDEIVDFLESETPKKIGLSLKDDYHAMNRLREVHPQGFIDLQDMVKDFGIGEGSLTKIYAILFGLRISKGQRLTNWEAVELTDAQKHYAALDAYACLRIYNHLLQLKKSGEKIV